MVDMRLGNPIFSGIQPCPRCSDCNYRQVPTLDVYGHHAMVCAAADGSVRRHNNLRDRIISILRQSAVLLNLHREWTFPCDSASAPAARKRLDFYVDDPTFAPNGHGFDVTVISPHSAQFVSSRRATSANALLAAEEGKRKRYGSLCEQLDIALHPMAIDVYGSVGPGFETGLKLLSEYISAMKGTCPISERRHILTQLSSLVQQRTAVSINRRRLNHYALVS